MYALRYYKSTSKVQRLRNTLAAGAWRLAAGAGHHRYDAALYL